MPLHAASFAARRRLVELGSRYHGAGWLLGTSGNLSARFDAEHTPPRMVVTASGLDKGNITVDDFVEVDIGSGEVVAAAGGRRPSAEASIHLAVYRRVRAARAVLHVHTVASTLALPAGSVPGTIPFQDLEMIKGWGLWEPAAVAHLPVFTNHPDVGRIAADIERATPERPPVPALLIAGHGLTAWGEDLDAAHRHVEITEFLCRVRVERQRSARGLLAQP